MVRRRKTYALSLPHELVDRIDEDRDLVSRSAWIERLLRKALGDE